MAVLGQIIVVPKRRTRPQPKPKPAQQPAAFGKPDPGGKSREPRGQRSSVPAGRQVSAGGSGKDQQEN
jgi:hypothetical protein